MSLRSRARPAYDPSTDTSLKFWLDANDSTTLLNTGGGAITNGATVGTWSTKAGAARNFTQWGTNARPTWVTNAIGSLAAVHFNASALSNTVFTNLTNLNGITLMLAAKRGSVSGVALAFTCLDTNTGKHDVGLIQTGIATPYDMRGRRLPADTFSAFTADATPSVYVETNAYDFSAGIAYLYQSGVERALRTSFTTTGAFNGTGTDIFAIGLGALLQETGTAITFTAEGYLGEYLIWPNYMTPDQLVPAHDYLCNKWGGGTL